MKILNRYIVRELFSLLGILLLVFTFVVSLWRIPFFSELVLLGVPFLQVLKLLGYMTIPLLSLSLPLAILGASVMAFSRLSADGEITAMKAAGQSLYKLLIPPLLLGVMALAVMFYLNLIAEPWGLNAFRQGAFDTISANLNLKLREGIFIRDFDGLVIYMDEVAPGTGIMKGIMLSDERQGKATRSIFAREGRLLRDPQAFKITLRLTDGSIHSPSESGGKYSLLTFSENDFSLDVNKALASSRRKLDSKRKYDIRKIKSRLNTLGKDHELYYPTLVEYHRMYASPFAVILFALIGPGMGIRNRRLGRSGGFMVSIIIAFIYYMLLTVGEGLGDENAIPPMLAMWLPNGFLIGFCLFFLPRMNREAGGGVFDYVAGFIRDRASRS